MMTMTDGMDLYTALLVAIGQGIEQSIAQAAQTVVVALIGFFVILAALTIAAHALTCEPFVEGYTLREGQRLWERMMAQEHDTSAVPESSDDAAAALDWQVVAIYDVRRRLFSTEYSMTVMYDGVSQAQATTLAAMLNRQGSDVTHTAQRGEQRWEATR
ncbi:MAG TPA: hypothetical protein VE338_12680 [Ktedonobacterales bacterium]|jgi:hypothetical protein|nr:hypothetical protein [Ktedonobacterales bacterium]